MLESKVYRKVSSSLAEHHWLLFSATGHVKVGLVDARLKAMLILIDLLFPAVSLQGFAGDFFI